MAKKKSTKSKNGSHVTAQQVGIGVGITAAAAAAAGAYFLYGSKDAKKNRQKVKSWMLKAKAEALEALESAENMTKDEYENMIDRIGAAYSVVRDASKADIANFKKEMKAHWQDIEKNAAPKKKAPKKTAKKTAKKAPKKTAKKTT